VSILINKSSSEILLTTNYIPNVLITYRVLDSWSTYYIDIKSVVFSVLHGRFSKHIHLVLYSDQLPFMTIFSYSLSPSPKITIACGFHVNCSISSLLRTNDFFFIKVDIDFERRMISDCIATRRVVRSKTKSSGRNCSLKICKTIVLKFYACG